jgi:hypothetical protein
MAVHVERVVRQSVSRTAHAGMTSLVWPDELPVVIHNPSQMDGIHGVRNVGLPQHCNVSVRKVSFSFSFNFLLHGFFM